MGEVKVEKARSENPLVSVILAVKNGERYLEEAIESVRRSTYRPIEIILVDGRSTDDTARIAGSFNEIRYILQKEDGVADAYNIGIDEARGEFVAFISCDDIWDADKLKLQIGHLLAHPEIEYVIAKVEFFLQKGCVIPAGFRRELLDSPRVAYIMETLAARKRLFKRIGKFDTSYPIAEDVDWYSRAKDMNIPMALIPEVLVYKRVHDKNISCNTVLNNQQLLRALKQSLDRKKLGVDNE